MSADYFVCYIWQPRTVVARRVSTNFGCPKRRQKGWPSAALSLLRLAAARYARDTVAFNVNEGSFVTKTKLCQIVFNLHGKSWKFMERHSS